MLVSEVTGRSSFGERPENRETIEEEVTGIRYLSIVRDGIHAGYKTLRRSTYFSTRCRTRKIEALANQANYSAHVESLRLNPQERYSSIGWRCRRTLHVRHHFSRASAIRTMNCSMKRRRKCRTSARWLACHVRDDALFGERSQAALPNAVAVCEVASR